MLFMTRRFAENTKPGFLLGGGGGGGGGANVLPPLGEFKVPILQH